MHFYIWVHIRANARIKQEIGDNFNADSTCQGLILKKSLQFYK